jgi:hypothetical protein
MLCALTVRNHKPGTFEEFRRTFMQYENLQDPPPGYVRFSMVRSAKNPNEVICFGFFDGTIEELRRTVADLGYAEQLEEIEPFVESLGADGLYEVIEDHVFTGATVGSRR